MPFSLPRSTTKTIVLLIIGTTVLVYFFGRILSTTGGIWGAPLDDTWIHLQFARNLAQGDGFSYNPGIPMPGSTAPLWTLLLALPALFTDQLLLPALFLSSFFYLLTAYCVTGFLYALTQAEGWALVGGIATLFIGRFVWVGISGMETTLFATLSLLALHSHTQRGFRWEFALFCGLGSQLRPEAHALFALAVILSISADWRTPPWRDWLIACALYGAINLPYTLFCLSITDHPLPNTFYAKAGSQYLFSWPALRETLGYHWQDNPIALLAGIGSFLVVWRRSRLTALWLIGLPLFVAFIVDGIWHHGRYTIPLIPVQVVAAVLGLQALTARWAKGAQIAVIALLLVGGLWRINYWAGMAGYNAQEILQIDVAIAEWLRENTPPDALIAVDDIGAIAYFSNRPIFDLNGLVSPEMWPIIRGEAEGQPRNEATLRLLGQIAPDYLAIFPTWHHQLAANPAVAHPVAEFNTPTHSIIFNSHAAIYRFHSAYTPQNHPSVPLSADFDHQITLLGYTSTTPDQLTLYWQAQTAPSQSYHLFIHLLDSQNQIVAQTDGPPVFGLAPTSRWQIGDVLADPRTLSLPAELPKGVYRLTMGWYQPETGVRLPVVTAQAISADTLLLYSWEK